ncbi:MAG TPA: RsmB/NOP family class I SAM-dependent RNA methyltransferase [Alphaproteobacteria bacterium]|jgi:16S rRNA (cytosine967-C5)-methyltransferase
MNPSARVKATIDVLEKINASKIPMDATIGDYMRNRRYIGSKDRADIVERLYNIMRSWARVGWHLEQAGIADTPRTRVLSWLQLGEGRTQVDAEKMFDGSHYGPAPLAEGEYLALKSRDLNDPAMPEAVRVECPPQHEQTLRDYFGSDFIPEMQVFLGGASLDLRVNTRVSDREAVRESLQKDSVKALPTPYSPWGLRLENKTFLSKTKAFIKGWVDIQDEGSQMIAYLCGAQPGMQVLDYCAGAGGKTLALAAAMNNKGRIVATDTEASRLEKGRQRFKRAHVSDIVEVRPLSDEKNRKWLRRQKETFDVVLADVPCSSTGTWRRNPDLRWRSYGPSLEELLPVQAEILEKIAKCVKPGGKLVYATCSLLPAENEKQIEAFVARHPEFALVPVPDNISGDGPYMRLTPKRHNTDGFFAAVLQRNNISAKPAEDNDEEEVEAQA